MKRASLVVTTMLLLFTATCSGSGTKDTTPPAISSVSVSDITCRSAIITWTTDEPASSVVECDTTWGKAAYEVVEVGTLVTNHSVPLRELEPGITYHYRVNSKDASGNEAVSDDGTFATQELMTIEEAMELIRQFEGETLPDLEALPPLPDPVDALNFARFKCAKAHYTVDLDAGMVVIALYSTSRSSVVKLTMEEAQSIAEGFGSKAHAEFPALTLMESKLLDHGSSGKEYHFIWRKIVDGAVIAHNFVSLSINPDTGEVMRFVSKAIEAEPFKAPTISESEAMAIAEAAFDERTGKGIHVSEPVLEVTFIIDETTGLPGQEQELVWRVKVEEATDPTDFCNIAIFYIDAHTGDILQTARAG